MKICLVIAIKDPYKVRQYLGQTLSIAPLFDEVIVHSNTPENDNYLPFYENVSLISESSLISSGDAFNEAINLTTGDWILPLCDDDLCDINKLEDLIKELKKGTFNDSDIVFAQFYGGNEKQMNWELWGGKEVTYARLRTNNCLPFTSFYKKSVWDDVQGYKELPFNDWVFWLEAAKLGKKFTFWNTPYFYFRYNHLSEPSLSQQERNKQPFESTRQQILDYIDKGQPC